MLSQPTSARVGPVIKLNFDFPLPLLFTLCHYKINRWTLFQPSHGHIMCIIEISGAETYCCGWFMWCCGLFPWFMTFSLASFHRHRMRFSYTFLGLGAARKLYINLIVTNSMCGYVYARREYNCNWSQRSSTIIELGDHFNVQIFTRQYSYLWAYEIPSSMLSLCCIIEFVKV